MSVGKQVIKDDYKGLLYLLFVTSDCTSCPATMEVLARIIQDIEFNSDNLYIVEKEYFTWIGLVKKFRPKAYPCLIKTIDSKYVESYYNQNIIKIFQTGLKDAI
jgi:thiol-disulfide isomerase/thioredoxin